MKKLFAIITLSALLLAQTPAQAQWWIADYSNRTAQPQSVAQKIISACTPTTNSHNAWQTFALWGGIAAGIGLLAYALYPYPSLDKKVDEFLNAIAMHDVNTRIDRPDTVHLAFKQPNCTVHMKYNSASTNEAVVVTVEHTGWRKRGSFQAKLNCIPDKEKLKNEIKSAMRLIK